MWAFQKRDNNKMPRRKVPKNLKALLESILFASAKSMDVGELAKLCKTKPEKIHEAAKELKFDLEEKESSIMLVEEENAYRLQVRESYMPVVEDVVSDTELPKSVLETLAVIAFKHPILQADLVKIRSNKCYDHLRELEQLGYIKRQNFGRTKKIALTQKFFEYFELPPNKVKEAFTSFEAVSQEIERKEEEVEILKDEIEKRKEEEKAAAEEAKKKLGELEIYEPSEDNLAEGDEEDNSDSVKLQVYDTNVKQAGNVEIVDIDETAESQQTPESENEVPTEETNTDGETSEEELEQAVENYQEENQPETEEAPTEGTDLYEQEEDISTEESNADSSESSSEVIEQNDYNETSNTNQPEQQLDQSQEQPNTTGPATGFSGQPQININISPGDLRKALNAEEESIDSDYNDEQNTSEEQSAEQEIDDGGSQEIEATIKIKPEENILLDQVENEDPESEGKSEDEIEDLKLEKKIKERANSLLVGDEDSDSSTHREEQLDNMTEEIQQQKDNLQN